MGEEGDNNSWIRGAHFTQTVYQRSYSSSSLPVKKPPLPDGIPRSGSIDEAYFRAKRSSSTRSLDPLANKQRSVSPHTRTAVPDTFKEARAQSSSTHVPCRPPKKVPEKGIMWKLLHNDFRKAHKPNAPKHTPYSSIFRHFASVKLDGRKGCKDLEWTKYFEHTAGLVTAYETAEKHMVDLSELYLGLRFAHGAHSKLYHGIYKEEAVAVKITTASNHSDESKTLETRLKKQFIGEVNLLSRLHHENVIKFVAACSKPPVYCIVTEYLPEGSLRSYLHKAENKILPLKDTVAFALEIARAMSYVHSQGVIHRDLKPENILIDEALHMRIADFGIACEEADCDPLDDDPGTYRWMAPEMIKHKCYGRKVDVYSFGLILWEMVSGCLPYEDMNPCQAAYAVANKNVRPPIPEDCPPAMRGLIEQCWDSQPEKRPEFSQIVKVLEQFKASIAADGNLELVQRVTFHDHKKGLVHWIQKHSSSSSLRSNSALKPKFTF